MRFLADMGISMRIVDWLRSNGHDVVHLREQNLYSLPDNEIFDKAIKESRIILPESCNAKDVNHEGYPVK